LPLYMTLPSAAAETGSPSEPPISMPLVVLLKVWVTGPLDGQPQLIRLASEARGGVGTGAGFSAGAVAGGGVSGSPSGTGLGSATGVGDGVAAGAPAVPDSLS